MHQRRERRPTATLHCRIRQDLKHALERERERLRFAGTRTTLTHLLEQALDLWQEHTTPRTLGGGAEHPGSGRQTAPPVPPSGYEESILL